MYSQTDAQRGAQLPSPEALWFNSGLRAADWGEEGKRPSQQHHERSKEETDGKQRHRHQCDLSIGEEKSFNA